MTRERHIENCIALHDYVNRSIAITGGSFCHDVMVLILSLFPPTISIMCEMTTIIVHGFKNENDS